MKYKLLLLVIINILMVIQLVAQEKSRSARAGIIYGIGTQQCFPYNFPVYTYKVKGYKGLINFMLKKTRKISYELQLEPGIYKASHQLLIPDFVQPDFGQDYMEQREIFTQKRIITEYAANIGILVRYNLENKISFFILGSTGPMYSDTATERLARGFAFSDIVALGVAYKVGRIMFELRTGVRHVSNLDTQFPNSGHNSSNIDFGISFALNP